MRKLERKYRRDREALDAQFKCDAAALGCIPVADVIAKTRDYFNQVLNLPSAKKHPELIAEFRALESRTVAKLRSASFR